MLPQLAWAQRPLRSISNFGQGGFTPTQMLVSSDGARVYVVSNLSSVLLYDFPTASALTIPLN